MFHVYLHICCVQWFILMCDAPLSYEHLKSIEHALFVTIYCSKESHLCCPLHTYQDASFAPLKICFLEEKKKP